MENMRHVFLTAVLSACLAMTGNAQTLELPTRGKEFWLGYQQNAYGAQTLSVRIASPVATSGTVSMPLTGFSAAFTVSANSSTTVVVPATAEHTGSEFIANKAVLVQALDSVTVTAVSFQNFTADAARVLPRQALGNDYLIDAYRGLPGFGDFYKSELLIVATADGTQIDITPSVNTSGGRPAGVPFTVNLNAGETYQVQSALASLDLTGTRVVGAATNGPCRAFAVFGGSMCGNVPVGCQACDHLFEQMAPIETWGTGFFTVPVSGATTWTYRVLASQNGTSISINGGAAIALNAGQKYEVNGSNAPVCITSNLPVNVVELSEGFNCAGTGDPSMICLVPEQRLAKKVTWSTVNSAQITAHTIAITAPAASVGNIQLDGSTVASAAFTYYSACPAYAYAVVPVTAGTHTVQCANGFIAYGIGGGTGESYAFALENNAPPIIEPDSLICTSSSLTLTPPVPIVNAQWYEQSAPGTILATTPSYTFTPTQNGTYIVSGGMPVSLCPLEFSWGVGLPVDPTITLSANGASPATVCQFSPVQLDASPAPDPVWYDLQWSPVALVSDPTIPNPIAFPMQDGWFRFDVTSPVGCGSFTDSVFVDVSPNSIAEVDAQVNDNAICAGQTAQLHTQVGTAVASDVLDVALGSMWGSVLGGTLSNACGSISGNALYFNGNAAREARTMPLDVSTGGNVRFTLKIANGSAPCDNADPGEDVVLEYSINGGVSWNNMGFYDEALYPSFTSITVAVPPAAQTANTLFRWSQAVHSGAGQDNWALDNVIVTRNGAVGLTYSWSPSVWVNNASIADPIASPASTTWFTVDVTDPLSGCGWSDSVYLDVQPAFTVAVNNDTTICSSGPVQLTAVPNSGTGISYAWTPNNGTLTSLTSANTTATPAVTTTYTVNATTSIGCTATDAVTITVGQLSNLAVSATDVHLCPGENTQLNAAITASGPVTIAWTPNNGTLSSMTIANPIATPATTTTYTCTVTDNGSGCQRIASVTVNVHGPYSLTVPADDTLCTVMGTQMNIVHNVPMPATISWSPAANLNSASIAAPTIIADTSATYTVTITDAYGCSVSDSTTYALAFDNLITPLNLSSCAGQSLTLDAGYPGSTYDWSTFETTQAITVSSDGTYVVQITDASLCQAVETFVVSFDALPLVDLGPDSSFCGVSSFTLDAGNPGGQYLWSTGDTTQTITVSTSGTFSVTVTDAMGCDASDTIALAFNALPIDNLNDVTSCVSAPITLDAGNVGCGYLWNTSATSQTISPPASGTFTVTVTTPQNCSATFDAMVNLLPDPVVDLGPDTILCVGTPLTLDAGNAGATFLWNTTAVTQTLAVASTGYYAVTASNGFCSDTDGIQVDFIASPVDVLSDVTNCVTTTITLDAGNAGSGYAWSTGDTTQTIACPTSGYYSVTITNAAGCTATYDANVAYATPPSFNLGNDTTLCDGQVLLLDATVSGATYLWNTGATTPTINVTTSGNYGCTVDNGWCTHTDAVQVLFNPLPDPLSTHTYFACLDEAPHYVLIDGGNGGSDLLWSTGETSQVILAGAYGWFFVQVTNRLDCTSRDSAQVVEYCPPSIYMANTFTPNGDGINDVWLPVGKSIASMELLVFDRYGRVLFESTEVGAGWDGTAGGELVKSDVYVWRMRYRFQVDVEGQVGEEHEQLGHVTVLY